MNFLALLLLLLIPGKAGAECTPDMMLTSNPPQFVKGNCPGLNSEMLLDPLEQEASERQTRSMGANQYQTWINTEPVRGSSGGMFPEWTVVKGTYVYTLDSFVFGGHLCERYGHKLQPMASVRHESGRRDFYIFQCQICGHIREDR
jgi:hypothetical protein